MFKVSIIVPVYNVEQYLRECLDSLVNQTYKNIEIICIDDGSTDSSGQILDEYDKQYDSIKVIHKSNGGLSSARNYGIRAAKGDLIAFVDSDDYVETTLIEKCVKPFEEHEFDLLVFSAKPFKDSINETAQTVEEFNSWLKCQYNGLKELDFKTCLNTVQCVWNKIYKAELLKKFIHFGEGLLYEDISFTWHCFFRSSIAYYLTDVLYYYRIRNNSIMDTALKEHSYDKAKHHLLNVEYLINEISYDKALFNKSYESLEFLIDRHTRRAKRMCNKSYYSIIDNTNIQLHKTLKDIQLLYK